MDHRVAFLCFAMAMVAGPALALEPSGLDQPAGNGFILDRDGSQAQPRSARRHARQAPRGQEDREASVETTSEPTAAVDEEPAPKHRHRAQIRRTVAILPPERPRDATASPVETASAETSSASVDGVATLTPADHVAGIDGVAAGTGVVAVLPPLRPSLPDGDPVASDAASSLPGVMAAPATRFVYVLPPARPTLTSAVPLPAAAEPVALSESSAATPEPSLFSKLFGSPLVPSTLPTLAGSGRGHNGIDGLVMSYARLNGVPEALVHRIIVRESKYNPRAVGSGGALGLMQIKHATARSLGYQGPASGLLDAETNITYAVKYLAGAYRTAGGDFDRAIQYYARGYYYAARSQGRTVRVAGRGRHGGQQEADARADDATVVAAVQQ